MLNVKFIEIIKTFSKEEFKAFGLFLNSPYYNSEKLPLKLYDLLKKTILHSAVKILIKKKYSENCTRIKDLTINC